MVNIYYCVDFVYLVVIGVDNNVVVDVVVFGVNCLGVVFVLGQCNYGCVVINCCFGFVCVVGQCLVELCWVNVVVQWILKVFEEIVC